MKKQKTSCKLGFTLLELLVVVLILGILAAIALPQYQYSVIKTKYMRMTDMARVIKDAQERYYLINNQYAKQFSGLDVEFSLDNIDNNDGWEYGNVGDIQLVLSNPQTTANWQKSGEAYMAYNLRLDAAGNIWEDAVAVCAAYYESGENGKRICRSFPNARNCKDSSEWNRYSCRIY